MGNKTVLRLCIADVNELLGKAIKEHVLRMDNYEVTDVVWNDRDGEFSITLQPKVAEPVRS